MDKILTKLTDWLEKAEDRRFFYMVVSLALLLDSCLVVTTTTSLRTLTAADFGSSIHVGGAILFACGALLFYAVITPVLKELLVRVLRGAGVVGWWYNRYDPEADDRERARANNQQYVSVKRLRALAVATDNKSALAVVEAAEKDDKERLQQFHSRSLQALGLLLAFAVNTRLAGSLTHAMFDHMASSGVALRSLEGVILLAVLAIALFDGVALGCGFVETEFDGRIYLPDHGMKIPGVEDEKEDSLAMLQVRTIVAATRIGESSIKPEHSPHTAPLPFSTEER